MSIYELKPQFQNLLRPIVRFLYRQGITANQVTIFACIISVLLGILIYCFAEYPILFILLPIWFFLRMALNAIDGMLAKEFNQKTHLGAYLNEVTDVISDSVLYFPFILIKPFGILQIGIVIWLAMLSEMIGILGQAVSHDRRYDGPMGKSDRAFVFGTLGLLVAIYGHLPDWFGYVMWVVVLLLILTCWRRVTAGLKKG